MVIYTVILILIIIVRIIIRCSAPAVIRCRMRIADWSCQGAPGFASGMKGATCGKDPQAKQPRQTKLWV